METTITSMRLKAAGDLEGNTKRTITASKMLSLLEHDKGIVVVLGESRTLVPWASIGSYQYVVTAAPKQSKPTRSSESSSANTRPVRAAKRAGAKARSPSRS